MGEGERASQLGALQPSALRAAVAVLLVADRSDQMHAHRSCPQVKSGFLAAGWQSALAAAKYSRWAQEADAAAQRAAAGLPPTAAWLEGLAANAWTPPKLEPGWRPECFDWVHYLSSSADLASWTASPLARPAAWRHFSEWGLAEARPFRFIC